MARNRFNFKRTFRWFSIRSKLIVAFAGLSVIPVLFVGAYGIYANVQTLQTIAFENLSHDVRTIRERTGNFLAGVEADLRLLRNSSLLDRYVVMQEASHPVKEEEKILSQIGQDLLTFAVTKRIYYQIILIDQRQNEILRIESDNITDSLPRFRILPDSMLRRGGLNYYVLLTQNLARDQISFTPAELRYRDGEQLPVISFAMPLWTSHGQSGMVVANVFAGNLFTVMQSQRNLGVDERVVLVGPDGHYLYHSDAKADWNRLLASREENNLRMDYPPAIASTIVSGRAGMVTSGSEDIIAYAPLFPFRPAGNGVSPGSTFASSLTVFESVSRARILAPALRFEWTFAGFLALFLVLAVGLGMAATRQFTRPIAELDRGAAIIAGGDYGHRLNVATRDEIEMLASRFNYMAASLEEHEREIALHRTRLEEMVAGRTRELADEKAKLQAILDNVPSAFVLLDQAFRIQSASASFTAITGLRLDDVRGEDCRVAFPRAGLCREPADPAAVLGGRSEVHLDRVVDGAGAERYIEHMTIPVSEGGALQSIVAIITDVTKRKQLEQHLIQSERLMATGEMAAIIAHEFRNALTSIKMILQLQRESQRLRPADRKSMDVALDSIYHMEAVVQELLNFARPAPMEFRNAKIDAIIDEALAFVRLRTRKQHIALTTSFGSDLPEMTLDSVHLKEAIINLLLNAVQAIEGKPAGGESGAISVAVKRTVLSRSVRQYAPPAYGEADEGANGVDGREIVLKKGSPCVVISVTDSGPGIERHLLPRIFDPFVTTKANGTGLGLPMVKRTVNAHGGIVTVRTVRGRGATFELLLPLNR